MKLSLSLAFLFCVSIAGAQTMVFTPDPTYDYSNNEYLKGIDTVSEDVGGWLILEQLNNITTSTSSITLYVSTGSSYSFNKAQSNVVEGVTTWIGNCTSGIYPNGVAFITVQDGIISGNIKLTNTFISGVSSIGDDHYIVYELPDMAPDCGSQMYSTGSTLEDSVAPGGRVGDPCSGLYIYRLIIAYSPELRATAGNWPGTQNTFNQFLEEIVESVNDTYINSNIPIRARLAFSYMTSESESGDFHGDYQSFLVDILPIGGGKYDAIATHQTKFSADGAILLVKEKADDASGIGSTWPQNRAIVSSGGSINQLVAAHEIGHMFNLDHNIEEYTWLERSFRIGKKAYAMRGNEYKCVMSYGSLQQVYPVYSSSDYQFPNGQTAGNNKAQGRSYMMSHKENLIQYDDVDNLAFSNFTFNSFMMSSLFAYETLTTSNVTVDDAKVRLKAQEVVRLLPGTWIKFGSDVVASIQPCENTSGLRMAASEPEKKEPMEAVEKEKPMAEIERFYDQLQVYPNPAVSQFRVSLYFKKPSDVTYTLRDVNNNVLSEATARSVTEFIKVVDTGNLPKGVYLVETTTNQKRQVKKVVVH